MMRRAYPFLLFVLAALPAHADDPQSFAVTTDTPQYCAQLEKQVGDRHSAIPDVQHLLETGTEMCTKGEIRGGIRRLRHALIILHHRRLAAKEPASPRAAGSKAVAPKASPPADSAPSSEPAKTTSPSPQ